MADLDPQLPRRAIIKGAGLGLLAGGLGALHAPNAVAAAADGAEIWSSEYWAKKGDVPLWMYRKRLGAPKAGEPARPVLFFVHGSSVTSRVFDLSVPGRDDYSVMNEFARHGFDCWTMDHENYGKSGKGHLARGKHWASAGASKMFATSVRHAQKAGVIDHKSRGYLAQFVQFLASSAGPSHDIRCGIDAETRRSSLQSTGDALRANVTIQFHPWQISPGQLGCRFFRDGSTPPSR